MANLNLKNLLNYLFIKYLSLKNKFNLAEKHSNIEKSTYWTSKLSAAVYAKSLSSPKQVIDEQLNKIFCDKVEELVDKDSTILDIGAGTGALSLELFKRGFFVSATDISQEMLNYIKISNPSIKTYVGNIFEIKPDRKFSCIVSRWFVPHFREWPKLIKYVSDNMMNKESFFIFDLPNRLHFDSAKLLPFKISKEIFGYDCDSSSTDEFFYAAADDIEIQKAASNAGLQYIERIPHGFLKDNMILANNLGDKDFIKFKKVIDRIGYLDKSDIYFYAIEKYLTPLLDPKLTRGSIVVLKK
jgi:2-polyprenyl-3-methyl-5-hydroxy-6-metoxy-1,4-benzoquinol methylase